MGSWGVLGLEVLASCWASSQGGTSLARLVFMNRNFAVIFFTLTFLQLTGVSSNGSTFLWRCGFTDLSLLYVLWQCVLNSTGRWCAQGAGTNKSIKVRCVISFLLFSFYLIFLHCSQEGRVEMHCLAVVNITERKRFTFSHRTVLFQRGRVEHNIFPVQGGTRKSGISKHRIAKRNQRSL